MTAMQTNLENELKGCITEINSDSNNEKEHMKDNVSKKVNANNESNSFVIENERPISTNGLTSESEINVEVQESFMFSENGTVNKDVRETIINENYNTSEKVRSIELLHDDESNTSDSNISIKVLKKRKQAVINSDSEDEAENIRGGKINLSSTKNVNIETENNLSTPQPNIKKRINLYESDDEDFDSETNSKGSENNTSDTNQYEIQKIRLSKICDSESSDDEINEDNERNTHFRIMSSENSKNNSKKELHSKEMTRKDAIEQRRIIKSVSQKMLRESHVKLPYHRPKSHTLDEFLKRRPRLADSIETSSNTPTAMALKMSSEQIAVISKRLEEREKEIEKFYKSDCESDDEREPKRVEINSDKNKITQSDLGDNQKNQNHNAEIIDGIIGKDLENKTNSLYNLESQNNVIRSSNEINESNTTPLLEHKEGANEENNESIVTEANEDCGFIVSEINDDNKNIEKNSTGRKSPEDFPEAKQFDKCDKQESKNNQLGRIENDTLCTETTHIEKSHTNCTEISGKETHHNETSSVNKSVDILEITSKYINQDESKTNDNVSTRNKQLEEKIKKLNPLFALKGNFQPRLRPDTEDVVLLQNDNFKKSKEVDNMIKRFLVHTSKRVHHNKNEINILNVSNGTLQNETISLINEDEDNPTAVLQKPGAKLKKLREELEEQMFKKRIEEWKKRHDEKKLEKEEDVYNDECGMVDNILDNEEEEEISDSETSEDDEEQIEEQSEKQKSKSVFIDDEAEESDSEVDEEHDMNSAEENDRDIDENEIETDGENEVTEIELNNKNDSFPNKKKVLKRIIAPEDSDCSDNEIYSNEGSEEQANDKNNANMSQNVDSKVDFWENNDDDIPLYQPCRENLEQTPSRSVVETKQDFAFLTPTIQLTALQGMNSTSKNQEESPKIPLPPEPSPLKSHPNVVTKLFADINVDTDNYFDELEGLCSGTFTGPTDAEHQSTHNKNTSVSGITEDKFIQITQFENDDSQENSQDVPANCTTEENLKNSEKRESLQSKQDSSQVNNTSYNNIIKISKTLKEKHVSLRQKYVIESSDEEADIVVKEKKRHRKYVIDDISEEEKSDSQSENSDEFEEKQNVDYDSEENEVEFDDDMQTLKRANDFFENEAELSESEWESADEDEKNLDFLEKEAGDEDIFNEKKLQRELERIHVRQVLDEDKREVRMLQELLLEDGELHGTGRERKFKWKNADSVSWNNLDLPKDDEEEADDIESELQWRKLRHEREIFLEEQKKKIRENGENELLSVENKLFKLGEASLQRSLSLSDSSQDLIPANQSQPQPCSPSITLPFTLLNQRGSFLARSEKTLTRIAEMTKIITNQVSNGPKNGRNFIFTTVDKTETVSVECERKRKAEDGTPKILKKIKIADISSTAKNTETSAKSLFSTF